jgi:hypothetical protein
LSNKKLRSKEKEGGGYDNKVNHPLDRVEVVEIWIEGRNPFDMNPVV